MKRHCLLATLTCQPVTPLSKVSGATTPVRVLSYCVILQQKTCSLHKLTSLECGSEPFDSRLQGQVVVGLGDLELLQLFL